MRREAAPGVRRLGVSPAPPTACFIFRSRGRVLAPCSQHPDESRDAMLPEPVACPPAWVLSVSSSAGPSVYLSVWARLSPPVSLTVSPVSWEGSLPAPWRGALSPRTGDLWGLGPTCTQGGRQLQDSLLAVQGRSCGWAVCAVCPAGGAPGSGQRRTGCSAWRWGQSHTGP